MSNPRPNDLQRLYQIQPVSTLSLATTLASRVYNRTATAVAGHRLYDVITPHVILGVMPTKEDAKHLKETFPNLKLVISAQEDYENSPNTDFSLLSTQLASEWKEMGVDQHQLPMPDFAANIDVFDLHKAVLRMRSCVEAGDIVYVHCKAGVGRSPTLILAYLYCYGNPADSLPLHADFNTLHRYVQAIRPQTNLNASHIGKVQEYIERHQRGEFDQLTVSCANEPSIQLGETDLRSRLDRFLASDQAKEAIPRLESVKTLKDYVRSKQGFFVGGVNRTEFGQQFLSSILNATNASWFIDFLGGEGPLNQLLNSKPHGGIAGTGQPVKRTEILDNMKKELIDYLVNVPELRCTAAELHSLTLDDFALIDVDDNEDVAAAAVDGASEFFRSRNF